MPVKAWNAGLARDETSLPLSNLAGDRPSPRGQQALFALETEAMARTALNPPPVGHMPPNTGDSTEFGDTFKTVVDNLNTMLTEVYAAFSSTFGTYAAGGGTATYKPEGVISRTVGPLGSSATNTSQTLASYTLPASSFNAAGQEVDVVAWGTVAANAAPKTIQLGVGGAFANTGTQTGNGYAWQLQSKTIRTGASTQDTIFGGTGSGGAITLKNQTDTSVETGTVSIAVTCADASAAQSNVLLYGFVVEYFA